MVQRKSIYFTNISYKWRVVDDVTRTADIPLHFSLRRNALQPQLISAMVIDFLWNVVRRKTDMYPTYIPHTAASCWFKLILLLSVISDGLFHRVISHRYWLCHCLYCRAGNWAQLTSHIGESKFHMMTSSNENIFRVTGHLCVEFTGHRWIPHTKASDAERWCSLWSAPE